MLPITPSNKNGIGEVRTHATLFTLYNFSKVAPQAIRIDSITGREGNAPSPKGSKPPVTTFTPTANKHGLGVAPSNRGLQSRALLLWPTVHSKIKLLKIYDSEGIRTLDLLRDREVC